MMLSIESYGSKWASTECETEVSFQTQVAYFSVVGMKSIFVRFPDIKVKLEDDALLFTTINKSDSIFNFSLMLFS